MTSCAIRAIISSVLADLGLPEHGSSFVGRRPLLKLLCHSYTWVRDFASCPYAWRISVKVSVNVLPSLTQKFVSSLLFETMGDSPSDVSEEPVT